MGGEKPIISAGSAIAYSSGCSRSATPFCMDFCGEIPRLARSVLPGRKQSATDNRARLCSTRPRFRNAMPCDCIGLREISMRFALDRLVPKLRDPPGLLAITKIGNARYQKPSYQIRNLLIQGRRNANTRYENRARRPHGITNS